MIGQLYENFEIHFPFVARRMIRCYVSGDDELTVVLDNGERVLYDDIDKTFRSLPSDNSNLTETECRIEFGVRLRKIMRRYGVTQQELAARTGITQPSISNYINGLASPSFYVVDRIAKALDCSMDDLRCT